MELKVGLLADYANVSREGKLNIMGIFEEIHAPNFPAMHSQLQMVLRIEATPFEHGVYELRVVFIDEDANELFVIPGLLTIGESRAGENVTVNQIIVVNGIVLPKPGDYAFVVNTLSEELGRVPLRVIAAQPPQD